MLNIVSLPCSLFYFDVFVLSFFVSFRTFCMWRRPRCKQQGQEIPLLLCCSTAVKSTGRNSNRYVCVCVCARKKFKTIAFFFAKINTYLLSFAFVCASICAHQSRVPGTVIPLCAAQCERMFNTTRTPGEETGNLPKLAASPQTFSMDSFIHLFLFFANPNGGLKWNKDC